MNHRFKAALGFFVAGILLSACVFPEGNDPFERLPEEQAETIYGDLFPFSVSVSTRATHRLERENKLVGYLTSDLVRLEEFEGQSVELEGVWRTEKMRDIFWVEAVKVAGADIEESEEIRFTTKNFTFLYPNSWDYTESPDSKLFFVDKNDPNRRVFLTLSAEPFSPEAAQVDPNFVLSGIAGTKEITPKDNGREQEIITLYANDGSQQYVFKADYAFDDFDKKRALLDLLESFVEGENQVTTVIEGEKIKKAELEATKLAAQTEQEKLEAKARLVDDIVQDDEASFLDRLLSRDKGEEGAVKSEEVEVVPAEIDDASSEASAEDEVEKVQDAIKEAVTLESVKDYENLIDSRAYSYTSGAGMNVKIPYNHWFQHFGATNGNNFEMGVANNPINGRSTVDFWLRQRTVVQPATDTPVAVLDGDTLTITKAWTEGILEVTGPVEFKNAMWSVLESVQSL